MESIHFVLFFYRSNYFTLVGGGKDGLPPEFNMSHNYFVNLKVSWTTIFTFIM